MAMFGKEDVRQGFTIFPAGTYKVKVKNFEFVTAGTGTPQLRWHAEITDDGVDGTHVGKTIVEHNALTDKAMFRLASFMDCLVELGNAKIDTESQLFRQLLNKVKGMEMYWKVSVGVNKKTGGECNNIDDYLAVEGQEKVSAEEQMADVPEAIKNME